MGHNAERPATASPLTLVLVSLMVWILATLSSWCFLDPISFQEELAVLELGAKIGGALALFYGLGLTWLRLAASQASAEAARRSVEVAERGQATTRFASAVAQLSTTDDITARLGGVHALEQIATDSMERDHVGACEVLTSFVRQRATIDPDTELALSSTSRKPPDDVQAVLTALARRSEPQRRLESTSTEGDQTARVKRLDLGATDLCGARLRSAHFEHANLEGSLLVNADLRSSYLQYSLLGGADLTGARLDGANLMGADFSDARLNGANLLRAKGLREHSVRSARDYDFATRWPGGLQKFADEELEKRKSRPGTGRAS